MVLEARNTSRGIERAFYVRVRVPRTLIFITRIRGYMMKWLNKYTRDPARCHAWVLLDAACKRDVFRWAGGGDGNCGCQVWV